MQKRSATTLLYRAMAFLLIFGITGCQSGKPIPTSSHLPEEVEQMIAGASGYITEAEKIKLPQKDATALSSVRTRLAEAQKLSTAGEYDQAIAMAQECYQAATRIVKRFYCKVIGKESRALAGDIQDVAQRDAETLLLDFRPRLERMIGLTSTLTGSDDIISPQKVSFDQRQLDIIRNNVTDGIEFTLSSDAAFEIGRYKVSPKGEAVLKQFIDTRLKMYGKNDIQSLQAMMTIKLKVVGYSDLTGFRKYSKTRKMLMKRIEKPDTSSEKKIRALLNRQLSELRAQAVADTVQQYIESAFKGVNIRVVQTVVGKGETPPPGLAAPFPVSDPRRRICRIYVLVL
jgi:outer membrane protein OmpA-like peptidoglycan-associated protein